MSKKWKVERKLKEMSRELGIDFENPPDFIDSVRVILKYYVFSEEASKREINHFKKIVENLEKEKEKMIEDVKTLSSENDFLFLENKTLKNKKRRKR